MYELSDESLPWAEATAWYKLPGYCSRTYDDHNAHAVPFRVGYVRSGLRRLFRPPGPGQPGGEAARTDETTPDNGAGQEPESGQAKPPWELAGPAEAESSGGSGSDPWQSSTDWTLGSQSGALDSGSTGSPGQDEGDQPGDWNLAEPMSGGGGRSWDEEGSGSAGRPAETGVTGGADDAATGAGAEGAATEAGTDGAATEAGTDGAAGAGAEGGAEDAAAGVGVASAVGAEAGGEGGVTPAGARPRRRWPGSSRLARHARVARLRAAVSGIQDKASGRTFSRLTLLPALLVIAWLLPAIPLLLGGSFALAPMLAISIPVALALIYFGLRQVPGRWPKTAQAKPGPGDRAPFWATLCTIVVAAGFTAWQIVMDSHQVIVTRDPGVYLNFGYWIAHHGSVTIAVSATAFGAHHPGLAFATAGFLQNGVNLVPQFLAGLPVLLAAGFWAGGTGAAVLVPPVIGGFAVLAFGGLTGRLAGPRWAPAGAIVLALALPEQYTSRAAFSETLTQVLLFGGLCLLIDSLSSPGTRIVAAAASTSVGPDPAGSGVVSAGSEGLSSGGSGVVGAGSEGLSSGGSGVVGAGSEGLSSGGSGLVGAGRGGLSPGGSGVVGAGSEGLSSGGSGVVGAGSEGLSSGGSGVVGAGSEGLSSGGSGVVSAGSEGFITADSGVTGDDLAGAYSASDPAFDPASGDPGDPDLIVLGSTDSGPAEFERDPADPDTEDLPSVGSGPAGSGPPSSALPAPPALPAPSASSAPPVPPTPPVLPATAAPSASPATAVLPAVGAVIMRWRRPSWFVSPSQATILALLAGLALGLTAAVRVDGLSILLPSVPIVGIMFAGRKPQWLPFGLGLVAGAGYGLADDLVLARPYFDSLSSWTRPFGIAIAAVAVITVDCALIWRYAKLGRLAKRVLGIAPLRWLPGVIATLTVLVVIAFAVRPYVQTVRGDTNPGEISYVGYLQRVAGLPLDPRRLYAEDTLYWVIWYIGLPAVLLGVFGFALLTQRVLRSFFTWKDPTGAARLWALPLLIIGWITVTVLWRPGTVPDQPWASRRLVPVVIPGLILVAVWGAAWLTGRARARGAGKAASSAVAVFCLGALLLPTTLTTFGIGVTSSSVANGNSKRLALQPVGPGQIDAVRSICTTLGPDASVVIVDPRVASQFTQVIRGMCNVPVAAMDRPPPVSLQPVISSIVSAHRRPVLLGADAAELNLFGSSPRRILNLTATQDAHELTRPPTTTWPIHYTIWMSQVG